MKTTKRIGLGLIALSMLTGCGGGGGGADLSADGVYSYEFNMYVQDDKEFPSGKSQFDQMIKDKFGIEFTYDRIPRANWEQKTNILFASDQEPDLTNGGKEVNYKRWASKGYLQPIDLEKLPNYTKAWQPEEFETVITMASSADGNLYYLPSVRPEKVQMCWNYRKDVFDKHGLTFPQTIDQLYDTLKTLKELYPDKVLLSSQMGGGTNDGGASSLTGLMQAYWMPELVLRDYSYVDPKTGEFVPFAFSTDRAREMFIFINKLYNEGLIDKEILSLTKEQFYTRLSTGHVFLTYNYIYNLNLLDEKSVRFDPEAKWDWTADMITAYPNDGTIYKRDPYYSDWGPAFSAKIDNQPGKFDAVLKFFDWCATDEGLLYQTYGVLGESYDMIDGVPTLKPEMYHATKNTGGTKLSSKFGILGAFPAQHKVMFDEVRGDIIKPLAEANIGRSGYYSFDAIPFQYTDQEEQSKVDLEAALATIRNQYIAKFFIGQVDPSTDDGWNQYISDLKKVGLDKYIELKTDVYNRIAK